jgi:hypothetical protein
VKTERLKSFLSHPAVAVLALIVAPMGIYEWGNQKQQQQVAELERSEVENATAVQGVGEHANYTARYVNAPGVRPTVYRSPSECTVLHEEEVIGVVVNGQPRAYLVQATRPLQQCVVNDVVAGQPISVVHAADSGVIRVLTPKGRLNRGKNAETAEPVDLNIVGSIEWQLFLSAGGQEFFYDAENIPLVDYPFALCSWRVWRRAYPNTDLYTGDVDLSGE